jgi:hypothetical protein
MPTPTQQHGWCQRTPRLASSKNLMPHDAVGSSLRNVNVNPCGPPFAVGEAPPPPPSMDPIIPPMLPNPPVEPRAPTCFCCAKPVVVALGWGVPTPPHAGLAPRAPPAVVGRGGVTAPAPCCADDGDEVGAAASPVGFEAG